MAVFSIACVQNNDTRVVISILQESLGETTHMEILSAKSLRNATRLSASKNSLLALYYECFLTANFILTECTECSLFQLVLSTVYRVIFSPCYFRLSTLTNSFAPP